MLTKWVFEEATTCIDIHGNSSYCDNTLGNNLFSVTSIGSGVAQLDINEPVDFESVTDYSLNIRVMNEERGVGEACGQSTGDRDPSS